MTIKIDTGARVRVRDSILSGGKPKYAGKTGTVSGSIYRGHGAPMQMHVKLDHLEDIEHHILYGEHEVDLITDDAVGGNGFAIQQLLIKAITTRGLDDIDVDVLEAQGLDVTDLRSYLQAHRASFVGQELGLIGPAEWAEFQEWKAVTARSEEERRAKRQEDALFRIHQAAHGADRGEYWASLREFATLVEAGEIDLSEARAQTDGE